MKFLSQSLVTSAATGRLVFKSSSRTDMSQMDKDRFLSMAVCYDRMAPRLMPAYDLFQDHVIDLLHEGDCEPDLVVDLGAGSGILLEKILRRSARSRAVWVDSSPDFRNVAEKRLAAFRDRVRFIECALEDDWERQLLGAPDAILSMSAIHHLESGQKRRLYARCFSLLRPGGRFFNIDEMSTLWDDAYRNTLHYWARHVEQARKHVPAELADDCRAWCERFDRWKARNIDGAGRAKARGDDLHEPFLDQMRWLRECGFLEVDLFLKHHLWSVIGGRKPDASSRTPH
ncbi:MAG: class I SAM-dependent methyltransferase [Verrucomicrobia bacterium]|nr:class I SAM-dependent methyltransferase [Verrucomicrobiota bacterium]